MSILLDRMQASARIRSAVASPERSTPQKYFVKRLRTLASSPLHSSKSLAAASAGGSAGNFLKILSEKLALLNFWAAVAATTVSSLLAVPLPTASEKNLIASSCVAAFFTKTQYAASVNFTPAL